MKERTRARSWAVQTLYAWEARGGDRELLVPTFEEVAQSHRISPRNRHYAEVLVRLLARHLEVVDAAIAQHLTNWSLARLSTIDRNILRLGVVELLFIEDVPPKVTASEMIRLAERYGTSESPRFINGVLDAIMRERDLGGGTLEQR